MCLALCSYTKLVLQVQGHGRHAQAERLLAGSDPRSLNVFYHHSNHLGSGHVLTKDNGDLPSQEECFAHGRPSNRRDARNRYRFIGRERDQDTKLCMTGPRTYDPMSGRFLQGDPIAEQLSSHESPYSYSSGNPVARVDASGYQDADVAGQELHPQGNLTDPPLSTSPSKNRLVGRDQLSGWSLLLPTLIGEGSNLGEVIVDGLTKTIALGALFVEAAPMVAGGLAYYGAITVDAAVVISEGPSEELASPELAFSA